MCSTVGELVELKGSLQWFHKGSIYDCLSTFLSVFVPLISAKQAVHAKINYISEYETHVIENRVDIPS